MLNRQPIEYLNELEISMKIVFKELSYSSSILQVADYPVRTQQPVDTVMPVFSVQGNDIPSNNAWYNQVPNPA